MQHSAIDTSAAIAANPSFTVSRAALLPVLDIMARKIIERRNTLPILSNVLIEASPSGELRLTGTNLDMELSATLSAEIEQPGAFTVSAAVLRDIVKKADKDADIRFNADDGRVLIASGRIRQSLPTLPRDDFPMMAVADDMAMFELPAGFISDLAMVATPISEVAEHSFTVSPARYAKGKVAIHCQDNGRGTKTRAMRIIGDGLGAKWTGREKAYIASPAQAERLQRLFDAGFDASWVTGTFDHMERGLRDLSWREADKLAKQWITAPETQEADVSATLAAPEPEIALCEAEIQPEAVIEPCPDPIADVLERLERLERAMITNATTIEAANVIAPPSGAMETDAPLSVQSKPKRSPAHIRAIMAYLALRKERVLLESGLAAASEYTRKVEGERDQAIEQQANARAAAKRYKDEMERAEMSERLLVNKRRRAVTAARVRSQAAWQLGRALVTSADECERLKRVSYQQAGHIINLGERVDKAEQLLKTSGYWPDITVTAPDAIRIGAMQ